MAELVQNDPWQLEFYYSPYSEPCKRAAQMIEDYQQAFPGLFEVVRINVLENPAIATQKQVNHVPAMIFYQGKRQLLSTSGAMDLEELTQFITRFARRRQQERAEPRPKPTLRYDGKSFDQWRTEWQTELSTAKRVEAVKALAAFGANGQGVNAAEEIVALARQYPWDDAIGNGNNSVDEVRKACLAAFGNPRVPALTQRIPEAEAAPVIVKAAKSEQRNERMFAAWVLSGLARTNEGAAEALVKLTFDPDARVRNRAIECIASIGSTSDAKIMGRLQQILSGDNAEDAILVLANLYNAGSLEIDWLPFSCIAMTRCVGRPFGHCLL